ncbi:MAG: hypothetical protein JNM83_19890 [Myxococcales bacterium]|jgi:hypothetical protein|nr:hypothetical protein [Myxococcales bacterium]
MPTFDSLWTNYSSNKDVTREALYKELGWDSLINNPSYENTCAVRVHLAFIKAKTDLTGRIKILKGPYKGKFIEPGQAALSNLLAAKNALGAPVKIRTEELIKDSTPIWSKTGIISFMGIPGYNNGRGGHIDLLKTGRDVSGNFLCGSDCYWGSKEVWFWEVN